MAQIRKLPSKGMCFSCSTPDRRTQIFVNVVGVEDIGMPVGANGRPVSEDHVLSTGIDNLQVPIAVGPARYDPLPDDVAADEEAQAARRAKGLDPLGVPGGPCGPGPLVQEVGGAPAPAAGAIKPNAKQPQRRGPARTAVVEVIVNKCISDACRVVWAGSSDHKLPAANTRGGAAVDVSRLPPHRQLLVMRTVALAAQWVTAETGISIASPTIRILPDLPYRPAAKPNTVRQMASAAAEEAKAFRDRIDKMSDGERGAEMERMARQMFPGAAATADDAAARPERTENEHIVPAELKSVGAAGTATAAAAAPRPAAAVAPAGEQHQQQQPKRKPLVTPLHADPGAAERGGCVGRGDPTAVGSTATGGGSEDLAPSSIRFSSAACTNGTGAPATASNAALPADATTSAPVAAPVSTRRPLVTELPRGDKVIRKGFLCGGNAGRLYGDRPSGEGVLPEGAGDPLGHIPKALRQRCNVVDARNMTDEQMAQAAGLHSSGGLRPGQEIRSPAELEAAAAARQKRLEQRSGQQQQHQSDAALRALQAMGGGADGSAPAAGAVAEMIDGLMATAAAGTSACAGGRSGSSSIRNSSGGVAAAAARAAVAGEIRQVSAEAKRQIGGAGGDPGAAVVTDYPSTAAAPGAQRTGASVPAMAAEPWQSQPKAAAGSSAAAASGSGAAPGGRGFVTPSCDFVAVAGGGGVLTVSVDVPAVTPAGVPIDGMRSLDIDIGPASVSCAVLPTGEESTVAAGSAADSVMFELGGAVEGAVSLDQWGVGPAEAGRVVSVAAGAGLRADVDNARAKFSKARRRLVITVPLTVA